MRNVSLSAGLSAGYLHSILQERDEQRDPSVEAIIKIANELGVSLTWLLDGVEMTRNAAKLLCSFGELDQDQQAALLASADAMKPRPFSRSPGSDAVADQVMAGQEDRGATVEHLEQSRTIETLSTTLNAATEILKTMTEQLAIVVADSGKAAKAE